MFFTKTKEIERLREFIYGTNELARKWQEFGERQEQRADEISGLYFKVKDEIIPGMEDKMRKMEADFTAQIVRSDTLRREAEFELSKQSKAYERLVELLEKSDIAKGVDGSAKETKEGEVSA